MRKHLLFILFFLSLTSIKICAQDGYSIRQLNDLIGQLEWNEATEIGRTNISGSPYLYDDFKNGEVYFDEKYKVEKIPLRLNLYNDEFEYKDKNAVLAFAKPERINKIVIDDEVFIYINKNAANKLTGYAKMWNPEIPSVLTKMEIEFLKKEEAKPYVKPKPDRFERAHDKHYIMKSEFEIEKITSVKKLIKFLGDHSSELTNYSKQEKISAGDVTELAKLVDYYQSLNSN